MEKINTRLPLRQVSTLWKAASHFFLKKKTFHSGNFVHFLFKENSGVS